jgi:hypothetical protein
MELIRQVLDLAAWTAAIWGGALQQRLVERDPVVKRMRAAESFVRAGRQQRADNAGWMQAMVEIMGRAGS